ncbi:MAG: hypothetical protein HZB09_01870 [Candidatus Yonathbacteria bacterium]|nr:hypothetical protein [Candidatus Yonathbacteria bacterium]
MNSTQQGTAVLVMTGERKDVCGDATIVVTGALNNRGFLNEQTSQDCHRAALEYFGRVNPVNHFFRNEIAKKTIKCSVSIVVRSSEWKGESRDSAVAQMKSRLVDCWGVPEKNVIVFEGRRPRDLSEGIIKHKLPRNILVVVGRKPLFAKWNPTAISLQKNGIEVPQYVDPSTPILLRRRDDRGKGEASP